MMKHFRLMAAALCAAFLLCGFTAPAYAYSDEPTGGYEESDPAPTGLPARACGVPGVRSRTGKAGQARSPCAALRT